MFKFQPGESYLWLFAVFALIFVAAIVGVGVLAAVVLPTLMAVMLTCELRSGVALDSWWRASHPRGTWRYNVSITMHAVWAVAFTAFAILDIWISPVTSH